MTQKCNRFTFRAHFGIRLFACSQLSIQKHIIRESPNLHMQTTSLIHRLRSRECLQCFTSLSLKDFKQKQMSLTSAKFRNWKQKLNRITGAKSFTFNDLISFLIFNYSLFKCINTWLKTKTNWVNEIFNHNRLLENMIQLLQFLV